MAEQAGGIQADAGAVRRLGDFTLLRLLGKGSQGEVWEARQESLGRLVALGERREDGLLDRRGELPTRRLHGPRESVAELAAVLEHRLGKRRKEIADRLGRIFLRDEHGRRPVYGGTEKFQSDPHWHDHILFFEYFHGDNGAGLGASHQTGWTGLVAKTIQLFGLLDPKRALEQGKQAAFLQSAHGAGRKTI